MKWLTRIEEIMLLAIWKLKDQAYGIAIREQVEKDTGVKWLSGAIYVSLSRLKTSGYVKTRKADRSAELGGRPRIYYTLSPLGMKKLISLQTMSRTLWADVPDLKHES
jgi:PadR family transcriptional regulator PadR